MVYIKDPIRLKYSRDIIRELLKTIRKQGNIRVILFNDLEIVNEGLCQKDTTGVHDNHIHVTFNP